MNNNNNTILLIFTYLFLNNFKFFVTKKTPNSYYSLLTYFLNLVINKNKNIDYILNLTNSNANNEAILEQIRQKSIVRTSNFTNLLIKLMKFSLIILLLVSLFNFKKINNFIISLYLYLKKEFNYSLHYKNLKNKYDLLDKDYYTLKVNYKNDISVDCRGINARHKNYNQQKNIFQEQYNIFQEQFNKLKEFPGRQNGFKKSSDFYRKSAEKKEAVLKQAMDYIESLHFELSRLNHSINQGNRVNLSFLAQLNTFQELSKITIVKYLQLIYKITDPKLINYLNTFNLDNENHTLLALIWNMLYDFDLD